MNIGRYQVVRHLATGGMADVFLARAAGPEGFQKLVVIKQLLPTLEGDPAFTRMFLDEARLAASLHHANIVQVFDVGIAGGRHFMAMEYLHGRDLGCVMKAVRGGQGVPLDLACSIIASASAGLHYAHECVGPDGAPLNIVHRDLSPHNVVIGFDGHVKVVDFGIAKAAGRSTGTQTGAVRGTIGYMSPEQARAQPLDRRTDVFALCVLLWELIANRPLFRGSDDYQTLRALIEQAAPPPSEFAPRCPPDLDRIVGRGLAREVEQRTRSAEELQLALESFAREQGLALTAGGLARFMRDLFPAEADPSRVLAVGSGAAFGIRGEVEAPTSSDRKPRVAERARLDAGSGAALGTRGEVEAPASSDLAPRVAERARLDAGSGAALGTRGEVEAPASSDRKPRVAERARLDAGSGAALGTRGKVEAPTSSDQAPRVAERVRSPRRPRLAWAIAAVALSVAAAAAGLALRGPRSEPAAGPSVAEPSATLATDAGLEVAIDAGLEVAERESGGGDAGRGLSPRSVDGGGAAADAGSIALRPPSKPRGIPPGKDQNAKRKYDLDSPALP
jgi:hypothetical protein